MNKITKTASLAVAMFAIAGMTGVFNDNASAAPPGVEADGVKLKLAYNINYIAVPEGTAPSCGSGHVIYTERGTHTQQIEWIHPDNQGPDTVDKIEISDCKTQTVDGPDGTPGENDPAEILVDEADKYYVFVKLLGPNADNNTLKVCSDTRETFENQMDDDCYLDDIDLSKTNGKTSFQKVKSSINNDKLFDDDMEDIIYSLTQGSGFKHAQFRIYAAA